MSESGRVNVSVYQDGDGRWRWRAVAKNHRIVNASEQGYRTRWWAAHKARKVYPDEIIHG